MRSFMVETSGLAEFTIELAKHGILYNDQCNNILKVISLGTWAIEFHQTQTGTWYVTKYNGNPWREESPQMNEITPVAIAYFQMFQAKKGDTLYHVTGAKLNKLMDNFAKAVEQKRIDKIPYEDWRNLVHCTNRNENIYVYPSPYTEDNDNTWCVFTDTSYFKVILNDYFEELLINYYSTEDNPLYPWTWMEECEKQKENDTMTTMPAMNFDFGPCTENVAISPYGLAVQTKDGRFLTYDAKNAKTIDVTGFTFNFKNMIYKMPAAIKDLRPGAMVLHQGKPMYVTSIEHGIEVVDILASEAKTILPISNMFGFDYVTTIISFMNLNTATPTSDNPFGNLMPFMMAQMVFGENGGFENMDIGKMMMFSMMTGQQNPFTSLLNSNGN